MKKLHGSPHKIGYNNIKWIYQKQHTVADFIDDEKAGNMTA